MRVSSGWIKEWLRRTMLDDTEVVAALERAGIEVEQVILSKEIDKRVVVALVKKVVQHPAADRLKLVEVETGSGHFGIVCGAPNVREGLYVALAQIGTTLPSGDRIEKATLRGESSEGMLCSEFELGIGNDHNGILELSNKLALGTPLAEIYPADSIIDLKTPANRWDLQSVVGLAREVAAMSTAQLVELSPPPVTFSRDTNVVGEQINSPFYSLTRITIDQSGSHSPRHMVARLRAAGMRSINPVVDVTNYVMLETGQPLHAFDAAKVTLPLSVRHARVGETLRTLDGVKRTLDSADIVIADLNGPVALAGLMGGANSEVSESTSEILLEAAVFDGAVVRKMAQRHGLRTEASARIERGLPTRLPELGTARALELFEQVAAGKLVQSSASTTKAESPCDVALSLPHLVKILGFRVSYKEAIAALAKLEIEAEFGNDLITVSPVPWWRPDLHEAEDLVEEIVRVLGYDKVPSTIPSWRPLGISFDRERGVRRRVRDVLWGAGAFEVMTYSFVSSDQLRDLELNLNDHLKLKNPLSSEQAYLRSTMLPSHLATLERNRMYAKAVSFYEISKVFLKTKPGEQPDEPLRLGVSVYEPEMSYKIIKGILDAVSNELDLYLIVKPIDLPVYAPGRSGEIWLGELRIGSIGQLHPRRLRAMKLDGEAAFLELDLQILVGASSTRPYSPKSPFPTTQRDIALLVPLNVTWQSVREVTASWDVMFVSDYYSSELPNGMKGLTIRLTLALPDRTPTETEAAALEQTVMARLKRKLGAERRN